MKKILFSLFLICLMALTAIASPQLPYILYGKVDWNDQLLSGARLEITHNGITTSLTTSENGVWVHQLSSYNNGDTVTIKVIDGCGTGDTCSKSIQVGSSGNEDYAVVDFSITGDLSCPPVSCPSCSGGGSGSYINFVTEEKCAEDFPCEDKVCPTAKVCPEPIVCSSPTQEECKGTVCDTCDEVEECPDTDNISVLIGIIAAIIISIGGGLKIYKNRAGGITLLHRHKGIISYHNPETSHRKVSIRHAKLSVNPKKYAEDLKKINEGISL